MRVDHSLLLLATLLASISAAPVPSSCDGTGIGIGVGVGIGTTNDGPVVRPGKNPSRPCPSGWTKSLIEVNVCVEIGNPEPPHQGEHHEKGSKNKDKSDGKPKMKPKPKSKPEHKPERKEHKQPPETHRGPGLATPPKKIPAKSTSHPDDPQCPEGQARDGSLLNICVDIDSDPFSIHGGIKIGGHPVNQKGPGGLRVAAAPEPKNGKSKTQKYPLPPCDGPDDERAVLDLCVGVGLGRGDDNDGAFNPNGGIKIGTHVGPANTEPEKKTGNGTKGGKPDKHGFKPPCGVNDDPALGLCVVVGGSHDPLVKAKATVGGNDGLLDVKAKVGGGGSGDSKTPPLVDAKASVGKDGVKADASIAGAKLADVKLGGPSGVDVGVPGLLSVKLGSSTEDGNHKQNHKSTPPPPTKQTAPVSSDHHKTPVTSCPPGQILHLGVCIKAKVDVPGLVKADAAAKVGV